MKETLYKVKIYDFKNTDFIEYVLAESDTMILKTVKDAGVNEDDCFIDIVTYRTLEELEYMLKNK